MVVEWGAGTVAEAGPGAAATCYLKNTEFSNFQQGLGPKDAGLMRLYCIVKGKGGEKGFQL